jgi:hypothetical protein
MTHALIPSAPAPLPGTLVLTRVPGASPSSPQAEVVVFGTNHVSREIADDVFRAIMGEH